MRGMFWRLSPELQLMSHYTQNGMTYIVLCDKKGRVFTEALQKIRRNKALLDKLSSRHAYLLGYLLANEDQM